MSLYQDISYLNRISSRLEKFKCKRTNKLWTCRCPRCGDSTKNSNKTRGYFYPSLPKAGQEPCLIYKCHNCGVPLPFPAFLHDFDKPLYNEYRLERYRENNSQSNFSIKKDETQELMEKIHTLKTNKSIVDDLKSVKQLSENHPVKQYVQKRKIPEYMWDKIFYAPKFFEWAKKNTEKFDSIKFGEHPRLVIPWYNAENEIIAYTARCFGKEDPKYFKIILNEDEEIIYGQDKLDHSKQIYVLEGPVDAMFLNAIAVGNAILQTYINKEAIYIPDADIRNIEVVKNVERMIELGLKVCMMPQHIPGIGKYKDINDLVIDGMSIDDIITLIENNTHQGLEAKMYFTSWKRCKEVKFDKSERKLNYGIK